MDIRTQCEKFLSMATEIHEANKANGFWDGQDNIEGELAKINLISSEIAEMLEAVRKDLVDDKLSHRSGEEVELADVMIRVLDYIGYLGKPVDVYYPYLNAEFKSKHHVINRLFYKTARLGLIDYDIPSLLGDIIYLTVRYANQYQLDLEGAVKEKLAYNAVREDHKPENRAKPGGKKF